MKSIGNSHKFKGIWLGRLVVLQRFRLAEKEGLLDFCENLKNLAVIRHPNIVLMMGFSLEGVKNGYIITEYFMNALTCVLLGGFKVY